jgi:hypothetical protein
MMKHVRPSYRPSVCRLESRNQPGSTMGSALGLGLLDSSLLFQNPFTTGLDQAAVQARPINNVTQIQSSDAIDTSLVQTAQNATPLAQGENTAIVNTPVSDQLHQLLQSNLGGGIHHQGGGALVLRAFNNQNGGVAQEFPDIPNFSTHCYDPFTIDPDAAPNGWDLTTVSAQGIERGQIGANVDVVVAISSDHNDANLGDTASINASGGTAEDSTGKVTGDFTGTHLDPGTYWLSVYVIRPFNPGGQWFWGTADRDASVDQSWFHNPGNGFGLGSTPFTGDRIYGQPGFNQNFELDGSVT